MAERGIRKQMVGTVVSNKMDKTAVVLVGRLTKHPMYKKYIRSRSRFLAHDPQNRCEIGDKVRIIESRPLSKKKRWQVLEIVERRDVGKAEESAAGGLE